jgi:hypothetical protein
MAEKPLKPEPEDDADRHACEKKYAAQVRYKGLLDFLGSAVAVYEAVDGGRAFIFRDCNRTGESIESIKREDLIGRSVLEVFPAIREWSSPV